MRDSLPLRRQWTLVQTLASRRLGVTVRELAKEMGASEKTIRRDLETLQGVGFPLEEIIETYGRKRWRITPTPQNPPQVSFDLEEVAALYLGRRFLEPLAGTMFWKGAQKAFSKVRSFLGDNALRHLEKMAAAWHQTTFGHSDYAKQAELIDDLMMSIEDQKFTLITYQSARATEPVTHEVYPYGLVCHRHALYLIAFDSELREVRNYKVNRIESVAIQPLKQYTKPKDFQLEATLQNAFGIFLSDGPKQTVRVRFFPPVVRFVQEHHWHPSQILTPQRDGSVIAEFHLTALEEIKSWIQSFGANALVLEPETLRQQILEDLLKLQELYESPKRLSRRSSTANPSKNH